jgi:hypothetical protein
MIIPAFFAGVEGHLLGAFTGRAGVGQNFFSQKIKSETTPDAGTSTTEEFTFNDSNFSFTLGLGAKLGKHFRLDGVFNDQFLYTGPDFVSGQGITTPGGPIIVKVSAGVIWD